MDLFGFGPLNFVNLENLQKLELSLFLFFPLITGGPEGGGRRRPVHCGVRGPGRALQGGARREVLPALGLREHQGERAERRRFGRLVVK